MTPKAITNCQTKRAYSSKVEADEVGAWLFLEKNVEVETYKCSVCENWHLSSRK